MQYDEHRQFELEERRREEKVMENYQTEDYRRLKDGRGEINREDAEKEKAERGYKRSWGLEKSR